MKIQTIALILFIGIVASFGQPVIEPEGGGSAPLPTDSISDAQRAAIWAEINKNIERLEKEGFLQPASPQVTLFKWPLAKAPGIPDFNVEGISNYVDQNLAFPSQLLDYNCGARTYDQTSGYNHRGIDIFTWPFGWSKMDNREVFIVAAAPGTIVFKSDGNFDRNCGFGNGDWNAVYIRHADNSIAWYGHMKNGSTTSKAVGATVEAGEVLGVVGSSGNSTGPHLHFEIYNAAGQLQEPYQGTCNSLNAVSWWEVQEPYRNTRMNRLMTHSLPPVFNTCPTTETINAKNYFRPGETYRVAGYFRDAMVGNQTQYSLVQPDGVVSTNWSHNSPQTYNASFWWWTISTTTTVKRGAWRLRANFNGQEYNHNFVIKDNTAFDYDGDGKTDPSIFRPSQGTWYIAQSSGGVRSQGWGLATDKLAPADFDGDGKTDLAVFRATDSNWYIFNSATNTATTAGWGLAGDLPVPADYGGDAKADIAVYRPSDGNWYRRDSDGQIHVYQWGIVGDKPAPADFNGDGITDMTVFRPTEGKWYTINSGSGAISEGTWGIPGDIPVAADYSGDGKADFAVFRPSDQTWYRIHSDNFTIHIITWGLAGDFATPGDYDGDGRQDLAVFRPSDSTWYVFGSTSGIYSQPFGLAGDIPTPNAFVY